MLNCGVNALLTYFGITGEAASMMNLFDEELKFGITVSLD